MLFRSILREVTTEDGRHSKSTGRRINIREGEVVDDGHVKQGGKLRFGARNGSAIAENSRSPEVQKSRRSTMNKHVVEEGEKEGNKLSGKQRNQVN